MTDVPMPGRTLITGPSGTGKTRLTAEAIRDWVRAHGPDGVVVLEFGPDIERDGRVIGGRLERFHRLSPDAWRGIVDTQAPRLVGESAEETMRLARENATVGVAIIERMPPDPVAVFVNDATIPFQHPESDPGLLLERLEDADHAVINAYDGEEFGEGPITTQERDTLAAFREWAQTEIRLEN